MPFTGVSGRVLPVEVVAAQRMRLLVSVALAILEEIREIVCEGRNAIVKLVNDGETGRFGVPTPFSVRFPHVSHTPDVVLVGVIQIAYVICAFNGLCSRLAMCDACSLAISLL